MRWSLPVPWYQWRRFRVEGIVRERESRRPLRGLLVRAFDKDVIADDYLGDSTTNARGRFSIDFDDSAFKDVLETRPDIYLFVFAPGNSEPVHDTSRAIRRNAKRVEYFEIEIPADRLPS